MTTSPRLLLSSSLRKIVEPLGVVTETARARGVDILVVGAVARDIAYAQWGREPLRATADIDVAVAVSGWAAYEELRAQFTRDPSMPAHRLVVDGTLVDLVPFGGVEDQNRTIAWPPHGDHVMSVFGFTEASTSANLVDLTPELSVPVASVPGLVALKLVAWSERAHVKPRSDGTDLGHLLRDFGDPWNYDRIYGTDVDVLDRFDFSPTAAGAALLGRDVASIFNPVDLPRLASIVEPELVEDSRLIRDMEGTRSLSLELLIAFYVGLTEASSAR
jgi:predicted nucleotidyltransferase